MTQALIDLIKEIYLRSYFQNRMDANIPKLTFSECKTLALEIQNGLKQLDSEA